MRRELGVALARAACWSGMIVVNYVALFFACLVGVKVSAEPDLLDSAGYWALGGGVLVLIALVGLGSALMLRWSVRRPSGSWGLAVVAGLVHVWVGALVTLVLLLLMQTGGKWGRPTSGGFHEDLELVNNTTPYWGVPLLCLFLALTVLSVAIHPVARSEFPGRVVILAAYTGVWIAVSASVGAAVSTALIPPK